jgi:hypothetical protein
MKFRRPRFRTPAGWSITRVPGAAQQKTERSDALQTRDRSSPWRSRISGAPLRSARAAPHPGHTIPTVIRHSCLTASNNTHSLVPAARFCVNALSPQQRWLVRSLYFPVFLQIRTLPSPVSRSQAHTPPRSRGAFLRPGFCILASLTPNRGVGGAPTDVRVQRHPLGVS